MPCISYDFYELRRVMKPFEFYLFYFIVRHAKISLVEVKWLGQVLGRICAGKAVIPPCNTAMQMHVPGIQLHFLAA